MPKGFDIHMLGTNGVFKYTDDMALAKEYLKMLLLTPKGSLLGDPLYGTTLVQLLGLPNDFITEQLVIDDIYESVTTYMQEITLLRKNIVVTRDRGKVDITLTYTYNKNGQNDMLSIPLLEVQSVN